MSDKLNERLHKAVFDAYAEAQASEGSSRLLSELQILIDEEVVALEQRVERWEAWKPDDEDIAEWDAQETSLAATMLAKEAYRTRLLVSEQRAKRLEAQLDYAKDVLCNMGMDDTTDYIEENWPLAAEEEEPISVVANKGTENKDR